MIRRLLTPRALMNLFVLILSLYGMRTRDLLIQEETFFEKVIIKSFSPVQTSILWTQRTLRDFFKHYILIVNTSYENKVLTDKLERLEGEVFRLREFERENKRLKALLKFGEEIPRQKVLAQVIGWDSSGLFKMMRINKGADDGIKLKDTVVTSLGLVGHVYQVSSDSAKILTILDENNRVDAIVARTRSHGIVEGLSRSLLGMKYVTRTEPVQVEDEVMTSGLGNIYPKGIVVGKISRIERESYGITQLIEIIPNVDFAKLEEVVVLMALKSEEAEGGQK